MRSWTPSPTVAIPSAPLATRPASRSSAGPSTAWPPAQPPPITTEVGRNGAAGDVFFFAVSGTGAIVTPPALFEDAPVNDLTTGSPQSNLDALSTSRSAGPPFYFSIDPLAVPAAAVRWVMPGLTAADILLAPGPVPAIYATAAALGLAPADDVDGVAIMDTAPLGVINARDIVYVTLAPGSPSLVGLGAGPADIIQVSPGAPVVIYPAALMNLLGTDDMDALSMIDPPLVPSVGPWAVAALSLTLAGLALWRIPRRAAQP